MKVMLINAPWINDTGRYSVRSGARWAHVRPRRKTISYYPFPFAMAYACALLKKEGIDARMLDAIALEFDTMQTESEVSSFHPDIVVIDTSTPSIEIDLEFARSVHRLLPDCRIVLSGPHATALPDEVILQSPAIAVVRGEYDYTLLAFVNACEHKSSLDEITGLSFRQGDLVRHNPNRPLISNLDDLPYPERESLPIDRYTDPACKHFPNGSLISSRGCPHRCIFCLESTVFFHSPSFRMRDPVAVVDEMQYLIERFGFRELYFDDSSFTALTENARNISREIIRRNLRVSWSCMADAKVDTETLRLMREAGCSGLKFGVETADPVSMEQINKPLDLNHVKEFVDECRKLHIHTHGTFMFGLPGETRESIDRTIDFAFSLKCTTSQFSVATPFPGTEFYRIAKLNKWLTTSEWKYFDGGESPVIEYPGCTRDDIIRGIETAKKRKIRHLVTDPIVFSQYLWKLYKMKGFFGLIRELVDKVGYLMSRT